MRLSRAAMSAGRTDPQYFLSGWMPSHGERRLAWWVAGMSVVLFALAAPFATLQLPPYPIFIAIYQAMLITCHIITAVLLYGNAFILRSRALLALATGYSFTAVMATVHMLTFPGLFATSGLLGGGAQTTAWLYMFWHAGFPLTVILYAGWRGAQVAAPARAIAGCVGGVAGASVALALLTTAGEELLPAIMQGNRYTPAMLFVVTSVWLANLMALLVLWRRRPHSVLDLWLMVVMLAWLFDIALAAVLNQGRFDLGFYLGRVYGLVAACFVLCVLLVESFGVHVRLARRSDALQRSEERFRALIEASAQIVWTADATGEPTEFSPSWQEFTGQSADEARGRGWSEAVFPEDRARVIDGWSRAVSEGRVFDSELRLWHAGSATWRWVAVRAVPLLDDNGGVRGWVGMSTDIDARKRADAQLRRLTEELAVAEQEEGRRISRILHEDLQQLLYVSRMQLAQLMREAQGGDLERLQSHVRELYDELGKAISVTRHLSVDICPPALAGDGPLEALGWLANQMRKAYGIDIEVVGDDLRNLAPNFSMLVGQLARELLFNVVKHAQILTARVELWRSGDQLHLLVSDPGCGFDPEELQHRAEAGYGLASVRSRIGIFGGSMRIDSKRGKGTRITVQLPIDAFEITAGEAVHG